MSNFTHQHKHYDMKAEYISTCENGSWKVWLTDNTAPSAKLRRRKKYTITNFEKDQWEAIPEKKA